MSETIAARERVHLIGHAIQMDDIPRTWYTNL